MPDKPDMQTRSQWLDYRVSNQLINDAEATTGLYVFNRGSAAAGDDVIVAVQFQGKLDQVEHLLNFINNNYTPPVKNRRDG